MCYGFVLCFYDFDGVYLNCFGQGCLTAFFFSFFLVRAKTSRHFSGAPVYISFSFCFLAFFFFLFFCNNSYYYLYFIEDGGWGVFSKSEHVIWSWVKWGRHSFVNGFLLNLTMQNHFDGVVPSLIYPLKTECRDPVGWTTINEDGGVADEKETHHACIWTVHSGRPVSAATFRGDEKAKDGGKCLSGRSMYKSC